MTRVSPCRKSPLAAAVEIATVYVQITQKSSTVVVAGYDNTEYVNYVCCFFAFLLYNKVRVP
jgi:hypothetical protein